MLGSIVRLELREVWYACTVKTYCLCVLVQLVQGIKSTKSRGTELGGPLDASSSRGRRHARAVGLSRLRYVCCMCGVLVNRRVVMAGGVRSNTRGRDRVLPECCSELPGGSKPKPV